MKRMTYKDAEMLKKELEKQGYKVRIEGNHDKTHHHRDDTCEHHRGMLADTHNPTHKMGVGMVKREEEERC